MNNNAVQCCYRLAGSGNTQCAAGQTSSAFSITNPEGDHFMAVSYKKLWKLLIDKDMKKKDLCAKAGISSASATKMGKNGHVTTEILLKICNALDCGIEDIMEVVPDSKEV